MFLSRTGATMGSIRVPSDGVCIKVNTLQMIARIAKHSFSSRCRKVMIGVISGDWPST